MTFDVVEYLVGLGIGGFCGLLIGRGRYNSGYKDGKEALYDTIQKLCEERNITLIGKDPKTGRNIEYKINEILDQAKTPSEK